MARTEAAADVRGAVGLHALHLSYGAAVRVGGLLDFLGAHAIPGLETYDGTTFTRVLDAPGGAALVTLAADTAQTAVSCTVRLSDASDQRDLAWVGTRVRALLDLDTDPREVDGVLGADPVLGPVVRARPGLRSPGSVDGYETAVRTVVGQQISVSGARTVLGRIVAEHGVPAFPGEPWRLFPTADALAAVDPSTLPMPRARGRSVRALSEAVAAGAVTIAPGDRDADEATIRALLALPGIGPWTADYLRMRCLGDPDVLLASDLGVRKSAADLGLDLAGGRPDWAPWRSYATHYVWAHMFADGWRVR